MTTTSTNPVVKTTTLRAYPEWTVRQYADGMYDARHTGLGLTRGLASFAEVVAEVREMERGVYCRACGGDGWLPSLPEGSRDCPACGGTGRERR